MARTASDLVDEFMSALGNRLSLSQQRYTLALAAIAKGNGTVDDVITAVTEAPDGECAEAVLYHLPSRMLAKVADQLYVDDFQVTRPNLIDAIISEARA